MESIQNQPGILTTQLVPGSSGQSPVGGAAAQTLTPVPTGEGRSTGHSSSSYPQIGAGPVLKPGYLLGGRYEILHVLGQGGMGAVYKSVDRVNWIALSRSRSFVPSLPAIPPSFGASSRN